MILILALFSDIKGLVALKFIPLFSKFIPQNVKPQKMLQGFLLLLSRILYVLLFIPGCPMVVQ